MNMTPKTTTTAFEILKRAGAVLPPQTGTWLMPAQYKPNAPRPCVVEGAMAYLSDKWGYNFR